MPMHDLSHPPFCTSHASMSPPSRLWFVSSLKLRSLSLSPLLQSKHPMHSNFTQSLHYKKLQTPNPTHPSHHPQMNSCLVVREISSDLSTEISSKDKTPKKQFSPETQYSCLLQGDGPISSDLNAANSFPKNKTNKKKKKAQPKDPPETHPSKW